VADACEHVSKLIQTGKYPLFLSIEFIEYLLKRGEYSAAGRVIQAAERTGARHPLLDKHHISWLWCVGKTRAALSFAIKSANHWRRSYLFAEVAGLYVLKGQEKKSERYFRLANALAADELQSKRPKQRPANGNGKGPSSRKITWGGQAGKNSAT